MDRFNFLTDINYAKIRSSIIKIFEEFPSIDHNLKTKITTLELETSNKPIHIKILVHCPHKTRHVHIKMLHDIGFNMGSVSLYSSFKNWEKYWETYWEKISKSSDANLGELIDRIAEIIYNYDKSIITNFRFSGSEPVKIKTYNGKLSGDIKVFGRRYIIEFKSELDAEGNLDIPAPKEVNRPLENKQTNPFIEEIAKPITELFDNEIKPIQVQQNQPVTIIPGVNSTLKEIKITEDKTTNKTTIQLFFE